MTNYLRKESERIREREMIREKIERLRVTNCTRMSFED